MPGQGRWLLVKEGLWKSWLRLLGDEEFLTLALKKEDGTGALADNHSQVAWLFRVRAQKAEHRTKISRFRNRRYVQFLVSPGLKTESERPLVLRVVRLRETLHIRMQRRREPFSEI